MPRWPTERQHAHVGGHSVFVDVATNEAGVPVRVCIDVHKEGATLRGAYDALAGVISVGLAAGVQLEALVEPLIGLACEPCGEVVGHPTITSARSIPDYVGQFLLAWKERR